MLAPVLGLAGLVVLAVALVALRSLGSAYRVARVLSAAPSVPVSEALELATSGRQRYVRVRGRVSSEEDFPDENDRPLVFRSRVLETDTGRGWRVLDDQRFAVPFGVEERGAFIAVAADDLGAGLVVLPRESLGRAEEVGAALSEELPPDARVRLRIEQVSAVELATVAGVPVAGDDGQPTMKAGMGRPLILTTLEMSEAMRVLAGPRRGRLVVAGVCLAAGLALMVVAVVALLVGAAVPAAAQSPSPGLLDPVDTRSEGEGPGLVGSPVVVALGVIVLGVLAAAATMLYVRLTRAD